jgi:hypothetical protein
MRAQRAYGRPGTRVIPAGWGASHAAVIEGRLSAVVDLTDPATATKTWDEELKRTVLAATPYAADVPAAIQVIFTGYSNNSGEDAAEERLQVAGYRITVPHGQAVTPGHEVTVTACDGDSTLTGRTFSVAEVLRGSERFQRDLMCRLTG